MNKYKSLYIISRMDTKTIDEINAITEKIRKIGLIPENIKKIKESLDKILEKVKAINAQILELTEQKNKLEADSATAGNKVEIARLTAQIAEYKEAILNIKNRLDNLDFTNLKLDEIKGLLDSINSQEPPPEVTEENLKRLNTVAEQFKKKLKEASANKLRNPSNPADTAREVKKLTEMVNVANAAVAAAYKQMNEKKMKKKMEKKVLDDDFMNNTIIDNEFDKINKDNAIRAINAKKELDELDRYERLQTTRVGGIKLKRSSTKKSNKKSNKKSKKLKGGYLYRKRNKYQTLSSTRKSKQSKSKRKYFKY